jgi:hypothetical protein
MSELTTSATATNVVLAARLRQAVQGCSLHNHGPVQAWTAIRQSDVDVADVTKRAIEACSERLLDLARENAPATDPRVKKEETTRAFLQTLLRGTP